jgi:hypothetical protein
LRPHRYVRSARALVAVLVVSAFALGSSSTASAAPLACGDTITTSVLLTADLVCAGDGPTILGNITGITVNFEGHSLIGSGSGTGLFIDGGKVRIKNGTIKGFSTGVALETEAQGGNSTFLKMALTANTGDGIGGCDIGLVTLQSTSVIGNGGWGVHQGCSGAVIVAAGSRILRNGAGGIAGGASSGGILVTDSFISENGGYGIYYLNNSIRLTNSFFSGNAIFDYSDYFGDHIYVTGNKFRNSSVTAVGLTMTIADLGGNLCAVGTAPFLPCVFP